MYTETGTKHDINGSAAQLFLSEIKRTSTEHVVTLKSSFISQQHDNGLRTRRVAQARFCFLTFRVGSGIGFGEVAGELDVGAIPENVAVFPGLTAHATAHGDPVLFVRGALASP